MAVGFSVDALWYQVGSGAFMQSFFSTITVNLEGGRWGSRFPYIMIKLYYDEIIPEDVDKALHELRIISEELKNFPPDKVVWDVDDRSLQPPWGDYISDEITDLSNYFVTSQGKDLIETLTKALETSKEWGYPIKIESI